MIVLIGLATMISTFLGGLFALRFKDKLHLILGFSAGAVIGVALFDLLPESIELSKNNFEIGPIVSFVAIGFFAYMLLDRLINFHCHEQDCENQRHRGKLGAASLSVHSFLDGLAIGLAFQVSPAVGFIVATAVLVHNFCDGINTVSVILKNKGSVKEALKWLAADALAPALGIFATLFFSLPMAILGIILAVFCGFFLYIGASDLLPESHHGHSTRLTTAMTILGAVIIYFAIRLMG